MSISNQKLFYQKKIKRYGTTACGVAWNSVHTQRRRFSIINSALGNISQDILVDAGCGFGDFYCYLKEKDNLPQKYIGIDFMQEMVDIAKEQTKCEILKRDILSQKVPMADWYIASGSMNLLTLTQTAIFIRRCYEHSRKGFIFNLLEGRGRRGIFQYYKRRDILNILKSLDVKFKIIDGYLEEDMTIVARAY